MSRPTTKMRTRRPTQADVAQIAGVSSAVVSSVLNKSSQSSIRVSAETRARVIEAMRTLGYSPNPIARSLVDGRRNLLGVFTSDQVFPTDRRSFFYPFLYGIERGAEEVGFDLLLYTSGAGETGARKIFRDGHNRLGIADGSILLGLRPDRDELRTLARQGYPHIILGRREVEGVELNWVGADYQGGANSVVSHLAELGHRCIGYLGEPQPREPQIDREAGYRSVLAQHGLTDIGVHRVAAAEDIGTAVNDLRLKGATAIVSETVELAVEAESILARAGLHVPRDISIAVFGEPFFQEPDHGRWTRFSIPREEMGRRAVKLLVELLDETPEQVVQETLACTFQPGVTTQPPPK
ncbi:MAG: LacI family DNA-binding transcriptional regulator [Porticoccaceae bacterium]